MTDENAGQSERQRRAMEDALRAEGQKSGPPRQKPKAGWYPHPTMADTRRYWDGDGWTDHIAPAGASLPPSPGAKRGWSRSTRIGVVVGIVVLGVLASAALVFGGADAQGEEGAKDVCEQFVTDQLKSPATAEFSDAFGVEQPDESWIVRGSVDSENGFGAMIRNNYTCRVRPAGGDEWTLDKLTTTGK